MRQCPICYEDIFKINTLSCGHMIHASCIIQSGKAQCPICRAALPEYVNKVVNITAESEQWGLLDKMVSLGWLHQRDIPIIDELKYTEDLALVKAVLLLRVVKGILVS